MQDSFTVSFFIAVVLAYLCGAIPTGVLVARRRGIEVRQVGSGNIGATNVARNVGKTAGLVTLIGDVAKGLMPVLTVRYLNLGDIALVCTAIAALLGHIFSPFLNFSGGKGVATGLGVFLGLAPLAILGSLLFFLATFAASRIVSLASLVATAVTPFFVVWLSYPLSHVIAGFIIAGVIILRHRDNITRLRKGQEPKFSFGK